MTSDAPPPTRDTVERVPWVPSDSDGPVFSEPWEAQAFAITLALHERGLFTWPEWSTILAAEIKHAQDAGDPDTGDSYYRHWLAALERILARPTALQSNSRHPISARPQKPQRRLQAVTSRAPRR
jgi:nitrile hydratase accessory protein